MGEKFLPSLGTREREKHQNWIFDIVKKLGNFFLGSWQLATGNWQLMVIDEDRIRWLLRRHPWPCAEDLRQPKNVNRHQKILSVRGRHKRGQETKEKFLSSPSL
ncbi:hypothetical protein IM40_06745 [Candidatus Paracaedimonas acanthamoebae]|nr:hypothetical protein IM40_06745 [Candidatus Paracaedimonas acanthamoebae]